MQVNKPKAPKVRKEKSDPNGDAIHTLIMGVIIGVPVLIFIQVVIGG